MKTLVLLFLLASIAGAQAQYGPPGPRPFGLPLGPPQREYRGPLPYLGPDPYFYDDGGHEYLFRRYRDPWQGNNYLDVDPRFPREPRGPRFPGPPPPFFR